ncbi:MAG TPA: DUF4861 family protein [Asticcacaulis sp.]|nr:DUF4861 family protein [Asticcacaulis sp.]
MSLISKLCVGLVALSAAAGLAYAADAPVMPQIKGVTLAPPADKTPAAFAGVAPYRYDDVLFENDRIAHRIYGHALETAEPPSSSGIDAWGKNVRWPFMERQLKTGDQHGFHGEGIDFYDVNTFRGMGGLGIWYDNKLWVSRNYVKARILNPGPKVAEFEVDYAPWPVDVDRKVWETRKFSLPMGTNFTRLTSTINSDKPGDLVVGIGISKKPTGPAMGTFTQDRASGKFIWWGPTDPDKGTMGTAVMVDPASIVDVKTNEADNYVVLIKVTPGKPFVYYAGAAWDKGLDFHSQAEWVDYVKAQKPLFDPAK